MQALLDAGIKSLTPETTETILQLFKEDRTRIFLDGTTHQVVGYIDNDTEEPVFTENFTENLKWMPSIEPKPEIILDMDTILEKINKFGMDSLYSEELAYLKEESNKV